MLPRYPNAIVGRQREVAAVGQSLHASRLVTIVGAGGIGKTRLAVEAATQIIAQDSHAVCFVDLEPLVDEELLAPTIAAALGAELRGGADPAEAIVNLLRGQSLLLVLDNCEQVIRGIALLVAAILDGAAQVRVLATSREPLRLNDERLYRLETLDDASSVQLFRERATHTSDAFALGEIDDPVVLQICRKLDGIPLAIELAAARAASTNPKVLLARLNERFQWRTGGKAPGRRHHETLQSLIDWSYDSLGAGDRNIFMRLGVFSGEFSLDAARYVIGEATQLRELAEKSLIVPSTHADDRYRMLESLREYALLRLRETRDEERTRRQHASFFAGLAAQVATDFGTSPEDAWRARFEPDLDNFRAALTWAQIHEKALGASMLGNLKEFWFHANLITEGLSRSQVLLASLPLDDDRTLGPLLAVSTLAWRAGETRTSLDASLRALAIAMRLGDARAIASARYGVGWALFKSGETKRATHELSESVKEYRALDDSLRALLAEIDYAIALKRTDPARGRVLLEQALPLARASGWPRSVMRIETGLAEYAFLDGNVAKAIELGREVLATARSGTSMYALTVALVNITSYLSMAGDVDEARLTGNEAVTHGRAYGIRIAVEWALQSLAIGLVERGEAQSAAQILGHVDAFTDEVDAEREPTEAAVRARLFEKLATALEPAVLDAELMAGRALTLDRACLLVGSGP
jgi:predicted ATPase